MINIKKRLIAIWIHCERVRIHQVLSMHVHHSLIFSLWLNISIGFLSAPICTCSSRGLYLRFWYYWRFIRLVIFDLLLLLLIISSNWDSSFHGRRSCVNLRILLCLLHLRLDSLAIISLDLLLQVVWERYLYVLFIWERFLIRYWNTLCVISDNLLGHRDEARWPLSLNGLPHLSTASTRWFHTTPLRLLGSCYETELRLRLVRRSSRVFSVFLHPHGYR